MVFVGGRGRLRRLVSRFLLNFTFLGGGEKIRMGERG